MEGAVTSTVTVHDPPAGTVPPVSRMPGSPAARGPPVLSNNEPPQVLDVVKGEATVIAPGDIGNVSVKATPLSASFWLGFVMVRVNVETPPARIGFGAKSFDMLGGDTAVSVADAMPVDVVFAPLSVAEIVPLTLL